MLNNNKIPTLIHYNDCRLDLNKVKSIKNSWKPEGGLWTSPKHSRLSWKRFNQESGGFLRLKNRYEMNIKNNSKILVINKSDEVRKYYLPTFSLYNKLYLDFEKLSKIYDCVWVKAKCIKESENDNNMIFFGWDCETVLIMNNSCIESYRKYNQ